MQLAKSLALLILFVIVGGLAGVGGRQLFQEYNQLRPIERRDYAAVLAQHQADVLLFSTATCPYCKKARESLDALGLRYRELDIDASADAEAAFKTLGERGVHVPLTRDSPINGFQPEADEELARASAKGSSAVQMGMSAQASRSAH